MDSGLASNADQPYGQVKGAVVEVVEYENPVINWLKLIALILFTFSLIVSMWEICSAMEHMHGNSIPESYQDAGGLLFGLFCGYLLAFGVAWFFGYKKRDEMRRQVVEQQIARQKALEAMNDME